MLLLRRLEHSVLPPKSFHAGISWGENEAATALLMFIIGRIMQGDSHKTGMALKLLAIALELTCVEFD